MVFLYGNGGGLCILWFILTHSALLRLWVSFISRDEGKWEISVGSGVSVKRGEEFPKEGEPDHSGFGAFGPWVVALVGGRWDEECRKTEEGWK